MYLSTPETGHFTVTNQEAPLYMSNEARMNKLLLFQPYESKNLLLTVFYNSFFNHMQWLKVRIFF